MEEPKATSGFYDLPTKTILETAYPYPTGGVPNILFDNSHHLVGNITFGPNSRVAPEPVLGPIVDMSKNTGHIFVDSSKPTIAKEHSHYFKDVSKLKTIDVYRVLDLFNVTDPAIAHATKKLLVAGGRGAGKDINKDIKEAIDTLVRWQVMQKENNDKI